MVSSIENNKMRVKKKMKSSGRFLTPLSLLALGLAAWALIETSGVPSMEAPPLNAQESVSLSQDEHTFLTFRRGAWMIKRSDATARYIAMPEDEKSVPTVSRIYTINTDDFPLDICRLQLSERNLSNYLWLINPRDGKVRFIRARRDGLIDRSPLYKAPE